MPLEELQNGRYRYLRMLGSGGMGEVRLMKDIRVSRQVAIKVIRTESSVFFDQEKNKEAARLFQREARAIAALEHPNILPLYDFGEEVQDDTTITYMVMPFCAEGSLASWFKQPDNIAGLMPGDIAHLIEQAADALQYAHDQHIVHLDVKPSNFLLRSNNKRSSRLTLLLADFGIARSFTTSSSSSRTIRGTPTSMAPEQWSGGPVPATDQYALAVMAYEMLAGRPPFVGTMEQLMYRHFTVQAPAPSTFNAQLPAVIDSVLLRALMKKPEERFPSITDFADVLSEALQKLPDEPVLVAMQETSAEDSQEEPFSEEIGLDDMLSALEDDEPTRIASHASTPELEPSSPPPPAVVLATSGKETREGDASANGRAALTKNQENVPVSHLEPVQPVEEQEARPLAVKHLQAEAKLMGTQIDSWTLPGSGSSGDLLGSMPGRQKFFQAAKRRPLLSTIAIIVLLLVVGISSVAYATRTHQQNSPQSSQTASKPIQTVVTRPTSTPTPSPTPTPQAGLYIAGKYNGSLSEPAAYQTKQISILIEQNKGSGIITGSVTFTASNEVYALHGTVDAQGKFSFTIQQPAGQQPLYFFGNEFIQGGQMYLRGNDCSSDANACATSGGYFTVGPQQ